MTKVFYKGNWQNVDDLVFNFGNRGIKYGDGFFETISVHDGQIKFLKDHMERMERTASLLGLELPSSGFQKQLLIETVDSFSKISQYNSCSIRIQFFRIHGSRYTPSSPKVDFYIECSTLSSGTYQIGQKIESVGIFKEHLLQKNSLLESIKSSNSLHYVLAKAYATKHDFSDVWKHVLLTRRRRFRIRKLFIIQVGKQRQNNSYAFFDSYLRALVIPHGSKV